ncbi:hypothetical protein [Paractinoplanes atraurantiacus]|uniref:Copper(I)-binding protein n=1 Tax=Paractinoplanes atraurantiacus TaxID=1036182 RepID=A0A285F0B5_9ACTN|nr:hypothetical protein [Actinoplanes atraurantiacus]SNY04503.1 hypothetical protein SAMN05421748_101245 [Actinoplanes atraurantiacus]
MRSLGTRRVALAAGVATVAVMALTGCSAGQVAETAILKTPISGLNTQSPDGRLEIRNLQVVYNSPEGYAAGESAQLELSLYNTTTSSIQVSISSTPPQDSTNNVVSAQQIGLTGGAAAASPAPNPEPSGSRASQDEQPGGVPSADASAPSPASGTVPSAPSEPAQPQVEPAQITIPALSSATFLPEDEQKVLALGLSGKLSPGTSLAVTFEVSGNSQPLQVEAPFQVPLSPASRGPAVDEHENTEE